jgi:hypothetical protein
VHVAALGALLGDADTQMVADFQGFVEYDHHVSEKPASDRARYEGSVSLEELIAAVPFLRWRIADWANTSSAPVADFQTE